MARGKKSIESWILEAMTDKDKDKPLSMLSMVHMHSNGAQREIHTVKFGSGNSPSPDDLASLFRGKAETYSQDLSGAQTFQMLAFYGKKEPEAFLPFVVQPLVSINSNGLVSEPPTEQGKLAQHMRHAEQGQQQTYRRQQQMDEHSLAMLTQMGRMQTELMAANRDLMGQAQEAFRVVKDVLMEQALNTHKYRMEEAAYIRASEERKKFISYLPMLINTLTGKDVFPQSAADTVLIEQIMTQVDEQTIGMLGAFVKPELMGPLMERFRQLQEQKNLETANAQSAFSTIKQLPGEADAAGDTVKK